MVRFSSDAPPSFRAAEVAMERHIHKANVRAGSHSLSAIRFR